MYYPDMTDKKISDHLSRGSKIAEFELMHRRSYFDTSSVEFYFPAVDDEEIPGEKILLMTLEQKDYFDKCQRFISEERFKPTEEQKFLIESICSKTSCDTPVESLTDEEKCLYEKYHCRFLWSAYDTRKMFFRYKVTPIEFSEDKQISTMLRHYFTSTEVEQTKKLVEEFEDEEQPDPDMREHSFTIVVAIAHLLKLQTISTIDKVFASSDIGLSSFIEGNEFDPDFRSEYGLKCDYDFEYGDINRTSCDTRYFATYEGIPIEYLPPTKELFIIETMSYKGKFKFSLDSDTGFDFEEALEGHYFGDDFIECYYKPFILKKLE